MMRRSALRMVITGISCRSLGAARAAQASRDATVAQSFYAQLGTDRSELAEVKTFLAQE